MKEVKVSEYAALDAAILQLIKDGTGQFYEIETHPSIRRLTGPMREVSYKPRKGFTDEFRFVDRRLQALRKAGRIGFASGKWRLMPDELVEG
ncbi:hypothetical protein M1D96_06280 [Pseudomonas sp. D1-3]